MGALLEWTDGFSYAIEFDAAEVYGFESTNETTDKAVERGGTVTDHVRANPDTGSVEGIITNSPLRALAPTRDRSVATQPVKLSDGSSVNVETWNTPFDRVRAVDELFLQLMDAKSLVKLTTGLRVMEDLIVTRYSVKKDGQTGNAAAVVVEFKQIRFATTERALVQPIQRRAIPPQQRGAQPGDNRSVLARIGDGGVAAVRDLTGGIL